MSGVTKKLMSASGGVAGFTAIEDVFSTYLYTGNGSTQTITNYIDLAGEGGLVWSKRRSGANNHILVDTERGAGNGLRSNAVSASISETSVIAFNSDGYDLGSESAINLLDSTNVSWTFRKAPRFFDVITYTGNGVEGRIIPHSLNCEVGVIIVKNVTTASEWAIFHRSRAQSVTFAGNSAYGSVSGAYQPTDVDFKVSADATSNASGNSYVAYVIAHDIEETSLVKCDQYRGNGLNAGNFVDLGFEPQLVFIKASRIDMGGATEWAMFDNMRGVATGGVDAQLTPGASSAEDSGTDKIDFNSRGFTVKGTGDFNVNLLFYTYIAIRRGPMRAPTSGTEVYLPSTATGVVTTGFPVDLHIGATQAGTSTNHRFHDRLRGGTKELVSSSTDAETTVTDLLFDGNEGLRFSFGSGQVNHFFRRAPEFFDVVAYTGDGDLIRDVNHNLGVIPELAILKRRDGTGDWLVTTLSDPNDSMRLNTNAAQTVDNAGIFLAIYSTESTFNIRNSALGNGTDENYIAYLFSTLAGISKVGSYTGNGSSQTINCGFTSSARFLIIKRTDSTGDWYVWDTARGIVAANDPHLSLNTTAAEVTTDDSVDPDSSGFIVNQVAATNINVSAASYIFYAVA